MGTRRVGAAAVWGSAALLVATAAWASAPAERLPKPEPERCVPFDPDLGDEGMATPEGLGQAQVSHALNAVIQTALYCGQPPGMKEVHLTYELVVGCDGVVSSITASDDGGAPAEYVRCVQDVIARADFDGHDMENGMEITYPVNVAW